jgi:hypothetical protein
MLLVIFGAGASYDSVHHLPPPRPSAAGQQNFGTPVVVAAPEPYEQHRPPLANQLFDNRNWFIPLMTEFGDFRSLVPSLRTSDSVEGRLSEIQKEAETLEVRHCQLASICYYLQTLILTCEQHWNREHRGITNHASFFETLELWRHSTNEEVWVVTFNYDTMIEQAMNQVFGMSFDKFTDYILDHRYKLIKLHGSVDWGHEVNPIIRPRTAGEVARNIAKFQLSAEYQKVGRSACPPQHLEALGNALDRVTKIMTIGWRATERHFIGMLRKPLTGLQGDVDLMVISGSDKGASETLTNLGFETQKSERKRALRGDGFSGLVTQVGRGYLQQFLR